MPDAISVRPAREGDGAGIARVQYTGWHEAYTGRMPQSVLDGLDIERGTAYWTRVAAEAAGQLFVAVAADEVVGFASAGACRDDDAVPGRIELYAIYVLAAHYGTGAGRALLDAAIGDAPASLWVLEDNPRARSFYTREGFVPDGAVKDDDRWGEALREVRLVRG